MMEKRPPWLKVRYNEAAVWEVAELMRDLKLNTVCREANCPNLGECYQKHTSTFLLLGNICTRNCRFCNVTTATRCHRIRRSRCMWHRRPKSWGCATWC